MTRRQKRRLCILITFSMVFSAFIPNSKSPVFAKKKIKLNKSKLTLYVGQKKQLKLKNWKKKVTWKSKKKKIATVSKKGWVKGKKAGKTTITCSYKNKGKKYTKKCSVTVKKRASVTQTGTPAQKTESPNVSATPEGSKEPDVTLSPSPDPAVRFSLDFEDGANKFVTGRQGEEVLTVVEGGYEDQYCLQIANRKEEWAGPQIDVTDYVSDFNTYHIEAYVKHTEVSNRSISCKWQSVDAYGRNFYTLIQTVSAPEKEWVKIDTTVAAPSDAVKVYLYFEMEKDTDDFCIDNLRIAEKHLDLDAMFASGSLKDAYADRFSVGCCVNSYNLKNTEIAAFVTHHYNTVTFENELKPEYLLNQEKSKESKDGMPGINTDVIDRCLGPAMDNGLKVRFHTLLWYSQTPDWYFCENYEPEYDGKGTEKTNITNLVDQETMLARIRGYITQIIDYTETNYPGTVYGYDVVNEILSDHNLKLRDGTQSLYGAIFPNDDNTYVTEAFRYAREATQKNSSAAKLYYNDYIGLSSLKQREAVVYYLADAKEEGTIDGLGMQAHQNNLMVSDSNEMSDSIRYFTQNGYEVQITELDFPNKDNSEAGNEKLAAAYVKFMLILLQQMDEKNAAITNFTMWNITDQSTWLTSYYNDGNTYYPSLFDENFMPKPAFYALVDLVKK